MMLDLIGSAALTLAQAVGPDAAQAAASAAPAVSAAA